MLEGPIEARSEWSRFILDEIQTLFGDHSVLSAYAQVPKLA